MKSIVRLKFDLIIIISVGLVYIFLPSCLMEPFTSSKANITPVKLVHMNPNSTLFNTGNDEPVFGLKAKISRVVPIKQVSKVTPTHFQNSSNSKVVFENNYSSVTRKTPVTRFEDLPVPQARVKSLNKNGTTKSTNVKKSTVLFPNSTRPTFTTPATVVSKTSKLINKNKNPLFLTSDSWNYLNSAVTDDDLRQIINGLPNDFIQNVTDITKHDPKTGQSFLLKSIIRELGNLKRSRMLSLDSEKNASYIPVNKGVRLSAKQRKPVLNILPLKQKNDLGKPIKNLIKTSVVNWNISGLLNNADSNEKKTHAGDSLNDTTKNPTELKFKPSPILPTTPSLMQVLAVPERPTFDATTFPPFIPNQSKTEFSFGNATTKSTFLKSFKPSTFYDEKIMSKIDNDIRSTRENTLKLQSMKAESSSKSTVAARKPRVPPKEDEYAIPSITTTSTTSPEVNKGYQTIIESTTPGSKVIWYNHNQTPEDTFYPNFDNFLVPPEESSIEILTNLISEFPLPEHNSIETLFSPSSSEITFKYDRKGKINKKLRPDLRYNSKENDGIGNRKGSRHSIENDDKKKTNKIVPLQQQATTIDIDHDDVRDYYRDLDGKNGGSSGRYVYDHIHKGHPPYGPVSYNGYNNNNNYHEIIPRRHQQTNRKPPPYIVDDTESYGAFNEDSHYYRDSYPSPPVNKHEIGRYRYPSYHHDDSPRENEHAVKEEPVRIYDSDNGHVRDEGPTAETDAGHKKEPKYSLKENSPGWGPHHHGHNNHHYGYGYHGDHGWKDPSKDFFSKAKDYFKNSDFSTAEKWFDVSIGVLAFLAFGGYIIMLLYQVFAISQGTTIGSLLGRSLKGAGEMFDIFFAKGPIGQAYLDELETIVKRAMANVKRIWVTNNFAENSVAPRPRVKGEVDAK